MIDNSFEQIQETRILKPENPIVFPARDKPIDPNEFLNRPGVHYWSSFEKHILPVLYPVVNTPERIYMVARVKGNRYDSEICEGLPKNHLSNWEDIASLVEMFPNGPIGRDGYFMFYLEGVRGYVFNVDVYWQFTQNEWCIFERLFDERGDLGSGALVLWPGNSSR